MVCKSCNEESKQRKKYTRGLWSPEEDSILRNYLLKYGHGYWSEVPKRAGLKKTGKSCRLRWINYLRPGLKRGNFSCQEQKIIIDAHAILGNRWSHIATMLPGRTDNEIKNFWHTHLKKKLKISGTDANANSNKSPASECTRSVMQMDSMPFGTDCSRTSLQGGGFEDILAEDNSSSEDTFFSQGLYSDQSESSIFEMGCYNSLVCPQYSTIDSGNSNCTSNYQMGFLNALSEEYPFPQEIKQMIKYSSELHMPTLSRSASNNTISATGVNGMNYNEVGEDYNLIGNCCLLDLDGFQLNESVINSIRG